jgi:hypothetical protein
MQNLLYFIHIPKTAGTSLRSSLQNHFMPSEVIDSWTRDDIFNLSYSKLDTAKLIMSHSGRIFAEGFEKPIDYAVILRDPIDLVLSQFRQMKTDKAHPAYERIKREDYATFFSKEIYRRCYSNYIARHVLSRTAADFHLLTEDAEFLSLSERESLLESGLESAVDFLLGATFVATFEHVNQLYLDICADRGWIPQDLPVLNRSAAPPSRDIEPELIELISDANKYDVELYRRVVDGLQDMKEPFRAALRRALRNHLTRSTMIDLWSDYFRRGWYPAEHNSDGQDRRWSGPEPRSSVFLPIGARNFTLKIIFATVLENAVDGLRLILEGRPIDAHLIKNPTLAFNEFMLMADIGLSARRNQSFVELEIEVPNRICPKTDLNQDDPRNLGIYLKEFTVLLH